MPDNRDHYLVLSRERDRAFQAAREARDVCTRAFVACRAGKGAGPTVEQMDAADAADALVDKMNVEVDRIIKKALGWD